jgi:penicillin-binding protein 1C
MDRYGVVIHELRVDERVRRLDWVRLRDISPALLNAVICSEDKRFYGHRGVDWMALGAAIVKNITFHDKRGASTITMQLASILNKNTPFKRRSLLQKVRQIRDAREIERCWSKGEILEAYLNLVFFRGELQGISSASRGLFKKEPHGLNEAESVVLASLLRAPNASVKDVAKRACTLGKTMNQQTDCRVITSITKEALSLPHFIKHRKDIAPHVAKRLLRSGKTSVVSTIDGSLQHFATEVLRQHLLSVRDLNVQDGALLVVENKTGDVLAYIGSSGDLSSARDVDGVHSKRQGGSILKPFLYALAIEKRLLTAASLIDDTPLDIPVYGGVYRPKNYDSNFNGTVTLRTALASSLNVPAVKTLQLLSIESFLQRLKELGIDGLNEAPDFYGPSLALGSADVSLWELTNAYRILANGGLWNEMRLTFDEPVNPVRKDEALPRYKIAGFSHGVNESHRRIFNRETSFIISDILSDRVARSNTFGLDNPLSTRFWTAVKTGTSKDMRDNWCIGYSSKYTVGVWVGNFSGEPMWNVSGITGAAPIWFEIMNRLHREKSVETPEPPKGVVAKMVDFLGYEAAHPEWFIKGTEPPLINLAIGEKTCRIIYPVKGIIIALDPDIPEENQRIFFESQPACEDLLWVLNGEKIGRASNLLTWIPVPGIHSLALVDEKDLVMDSVNFEVRII